MPAAKDTLSIRLPYATADELVQKFGLCLTKGGVYLRLREVRPLGAPVRVELKLSSGEPAIFADGEVCFVTGEGGGSPGMGVRFLAVDPACQPLLERACKGRPGADAPLPPLPPGMGAARGQAAPPPAATAAPSAPVVLGPPQIKAPEPAPAAVESPLARVKPAPANPDGPIIGIDLGTTFSCVAFVKGGRPYVIPSKEGYNTIPSIVAVNARNRIVVGHPAQSQMLTNPKQTIYGSKRLVGRPFHSPVVSQVRERFQYEVVEGEKGEAAVKLGGRVWSLQEIAALILLEARETAQNHLGREVHRAVITVPAYYNDNQRQAVREAGALAGLHVERILNEPTAAALAFGHGRKLNGQKVLLYDLGGGTFDASLMQLNGDVYEVLSTGGDTFLGGVDFDGLILGYLLESFEKKNGLEFQGDEVALQRVADAGERAKRVLSEKTEARVHVPFLMMQDGKPLDLDVILTRAQLERLCGKLVERTVQVCGEVCQAGKVLPKDVDDVLLVGGQSRMPLVHQRVTEFFGKPPHKNVHPDEAVALGAALLGYSLGRPDGVVLVDVLPMAIGVGMPAGRFKKIVERNTPLPHTKTYGLATTKDDQTDLELNVFQGDSDFVDENEFLGTVKLAGLPKAPKGAVKISLTFSLGTECLLSVAAKELSRGNVIKATLVTRTTPEEVKARLAQRGAEEPASAPASGPATGGFVGWIKRLFGRGDTGRGAPAQQARQPGGSARPPQA